MRVRRLSLIAGARRVALGALLVALVAPGLGWTSAEAAAPTPPAGPADSPEAWSIHTSPNTVDGWTTNVLAGVTCVSTSSCWAVGHHDVGAGRLQTLVEQWDGTSWAIVASPSTSAVQDNSLQAVTCASASDCWAVGYSTGGGPERTLIERWNGAEWSIVSSPNTSGAQRNYLYGVACGSGSDCWAVGYYLNGSTYQTLIQRWDGSAWTVAVSPNVSPTTHSRLSGITCQSASSCWAVGYFTAGVDQALLARWDGTSWTLDASPNTNATQHNRLSGVTCAAADDCWAVGSVQGSVYQTLVKRWNGTLWSNVDSPSPSGTQNNFLTAVDCVSVSDCWAVGNYYAGSASRTITQRWDGSAWATVASPNASATQSNVLAGLACVSAADCRAVGNYYVGNGIYQTLGQRWDGLTWALSDVPNLTSPKDNRLLGVTCVTASDCWSVGSASGTSNVQTLIERWDGVAWAIVPSPNTSASKDNSLSGVTCLSASDCWAVGGASGAGAVQTLIERWDGTAWTIVTSANSSPTQGNYLNAVTCASASDCWAVGTYNAGGTDRTLAQHWDGAAWTLVSTPNISPTQGTYLSSVTCASADDCWAVGYARDYNAPPQIKSYFLIVVRWDGASWTLDASPNANATHNQMLRGVACVSATDCWAVGFDWVVGEQYFHTLIQRWDGSSWTVVSSPNTSASAYNLLSAVTCTSASS